MRPKLNLIEIAAPAQKTRVTRTLFADHADAKLVELRRIHVAR